MANETQRTSLWVQKLAKSTGLQSTRLSDQLQAQFGTTSKRRILGIIGDNGQPWQQQFNTYVDSL